MRLAPTRAASSTRSASAEPERVGVVEPGVHAGPRRLAAQAARRAGCGAARASRPRRTGRVARARISSTRSRPPDVPISAAHSSIVSGGQPCASNSSCQAVKTGPSVSRISPSKSKTTASTAGSIDVTGRDPDELDQHAVGIDDRRHLAPRAAGPRHDDPPGLTRRDRAPAAGRAPRRRRRSTTAGRTRAGRGQHGRGVVGRQRAGRRRTARARRCPASAPGRIAEEDRTQAVRGGDEQRAPVAVEVSCPSSPRSRRRRARSATRPRRRARRSRCDARAPSSLISFE